MTEVVSAADVRGYLQITGTTGIYSDASIGSNIRTARAFLERNTNRVFLDTSATKLFTSQGRTAVTIPGLRTVSGVDPVTLQSTPLTADSTYYLIPDVQQSGVYTSISFRGFGSRSYGYAYLSNPEWFDRNLDQAPYGWMYSLPNDLSITGSWGYTDAGMPEEFRFANKVLAGWYTKRPDALLANVIITPEGTALSYGDFPLEVSAFIRGWRLEPDQVVAVG
jgi:hypothetical protein